jgi:hypothetical protein
VLGLVDTDQYCAALLGRNVFSATKYDCEEDIVTHILIIVSWLGGAVQGAAISTQEFTSAERCDAARLALIDYAKARGAEETLRGFCTQK